MVAGRTAAGGLSTLLVERELVGGECAYWACIPSKTLITPVELRAAVGRSFGLSIPELDWPKVAAYRNQMIRDLDDSKQVREYEDNGVTVVKAEGRLVERGVIEAGGKRYRGEHIVVATGSQPIVPPIEGLAEAGFWTNREATTANELPRSLICIGGGAVSVELGQMMAGYGTKVTVIERSPHLLAREEARLGEALAKAFERQGIEVFTDTGATRVRAENGEKVVTLDDGRELRAEELLLGVGRRPRVEGLGFEHYGLSAGRALSVDDSGLAAPGLWGVGDVTGRAMLTHVAKYQARVVAANILAGSDEGARGSVEGGNRAADLRAVPRVVFTDPLVAAIGHTRASAEEEGLETTVGELTFAHLARPWTVEPDPDGGLWLLADKSSHELVGAWGYGNLVSEWIHVAGLAIKARLTTEQLADSMYQFPTYAEAYIAAAEDASEEAAEDAAGG